MHVLIGDINFPEALWPNANTSVELHRKFFDLLMVDLCHSQLITKPTHINGNTLDLLFSNISELISGVSVLGHRKACSSDNFVVGLPSRKFSYTNCLDNSN